MCDPCGTIVNAASRRISTKRRGRRFYYGLGRQSYINARRVHAFGALAVLGFPVPKGHGYVAGTNRSGDFFVIGQSRRDMVM